MKFVRNNIRYRSAASKALEGYYNSKAFVLHELTRSRNGFGDTAKEIMLLLFNAHADWLSFSENLLLDKKTVTKEDIVRMLESLDSVANKVSKIFDRHTDVFNPDFVRMWRHIHQQPYYAVKESIQMTEDMPQILAFPFATECLGEYLNTTLFELYELDCLLGSNFVVKQCSTNNSQPDTLVIFLDDSTLRYRALNNTSPERERFEYYKQEVIDSRKRFSVEVRDYSKRTDGASTRTEALNEIESYFSEMENVLEVKFVRPHGETA